MSASPDQVNLSSVYTNTLPAILDQLGISLVVSTYQAGKVILVRNDGGTLNTHFRTFAKPMGIDHNNGRLTIGGSNTVWYYRNMPAVAPKIEPIGKHDAAFLPRRIHVTGDIDIHELAWGADDLWIINTKFCCLATLDENYSFVPRWRPSFLSALAPEDRCHLNGLAMIDGEPRYVTALGETDTPGGWRANKRSGGILMELPTGRVVLRGLSMPHSPRWYQGRLWILESGEGSLAWVDVEKGTWHPVVKLPGFTRGIDFVGPLAFIGLSQVRESATFSGIPLVERLNERICGVWVVNWQSGEIVGFLRFETGVQEIFAVQALPARFPELVEWGDQRLMTSYALPDEALADVPALLRGVPSVSEPPPPAEVIELVNQAAALLDQDEVSTALGFLAQAETLKADQPEIFNNRGNAFTAQNLLDEAVAEYEKAIRLRYDFPDAHLNLAMALLKMGNYERGWLEWEWRWRTGHFTPFTPPHPRWQGQPLPNATLLVHTEQGAGDVIQFARFLPLAAQRVGRLLVVAPSSLHALLATIPGVTYLTTARTFTSEQFNTYVPLMSLPGVFGTTLATLPAATPYLRVPEGRPLSLPRAPQGHRKIGIVWAGSPTQGNDRNRSATLATFAPLFALPNTSWYSLQVGEKAAELDEWKANNPRAPLIHDLRPLLHDWADTAAAIDQLDLVIGVDTGVVHLAGALGKPAYVLLPYAPDWRWMLEGSDSPWYSSLRLFRQPAPGTWDAVTSAIFQALG